VRVDQHLQCVGHRPLRLADQRGGGGQPDGRPLPDAEQPEGAGRVGAGAVAVRQGVEADLEAGAHGQVARGELVHPAALVGQAVGQRPYGPGAAGGQPRARDPDGQRQARADAEDVARRAGLGLGAVGPDDAGEQQ
jgi:hypothetical protein